MATKPLEDVATLTEADAATALSGTVSQEKHEDDDVKMANPHAPSKEEVAFTTPPNAPTKDQSQDNACATSEPTEKGSGPPSMADSTDPSKPPTGQATMQPDKANDQAPHGNLTEVVAETPTTAIIDRAGKSATPLPDVDSTLKWTPVPSPRRSKKRRSSSDTNPCQVKTSVQVHDPCERTRCELAVATPSVLESLAKRKHSNLERLIADLLGRTIDRLEYLTGGRLVIHAWALKNETIAPPLKVRKSTTLKTQLSTLTFQQLGQYFRGFNTNLKRNKKFVDIRLSLTDKTDELFSNGTPTHAR